MSSFSFELSLFERKALYQRCAQDPEALSRTLAQWEDQQLVAYVHEVCAGHASLGNPLTTAVYRALMRGDNSGRTHGALRILHTYGTDRHFRWDQCPEFVENLDKLFITRPYTAWALCAGYPKDTPWLQTVCQTKNWDAHWTNVFLGPVMDHSGAEIQLLCDLGTPEQVVSTLENYVRLDTPFDVDAMDHTVWHDDVVVHGMSYLGYLHQWRAGSNHARRPHLSSHEKTSTCALWNNPQLLELSVLRRKNPQALHPAFPELVLLESASEWARYRVQAGAMLERAGLVVSNDGDFSMEF